MTDSLSSTARKCSQCGGGKPGGGTTPAPPAQPGLPNSSCHVQAQELLLPPPRFLGAAVSSLPAPRALFSQYSCKAVPAAAPSPAPSLRAWRDTGAPLWAEQAPGREGGGLGHQPGQHPCLHLPGPGAEGPEAPHHPCSEKRPPPRHLPGSVKSVRRHPEDTSLAGRQQVLPALASCSGTGRASGCDGPLPARPWHRAQNPGTFLELSSATHFPAAAAGLRLSPQPLRAATPLPLASSSQPAPPKLSTWAGSAPACATQQCYCALLRGSCHPPPQLLSQACTTCLHSHRPLRGARPTESVQDPQKCAGEPLSARGV